MATRLILKVTKLLHKSLTKVELIISGNCRWFENHQNNRSHASRSGSDVFALILSKEFSYEVAKRIEKESNYS